MSVVADYPDYSQHVANASQIAATGVPLLTLSNQLYSKTITGLAAGSVSTSGTLKASQIGYEVIASATFAVGTVTPFVKVQLIWTDSTSAFVVATDTYIMPGATGGGGFTIRGYGPTKADLVSVNFTNLDSTNPVNITAVMLQNSRVYPRDSWHWLNRQDAPLTVPGWTLPALPDDESVLGVLDGITIPASSQNAYLFGMHAGMVNVGYEVNTGAASNLTIRIRPKPDTVYSGHNIIYSAANPPSNFQIAGARSPLGVVLVNAATTAMVMSMSMIRAD